MSTLDWILVAIAITLAVYALAVIGLIVAGRRSEARALARLIPDCMRFVRALMADRRVPRRRKALLVLLIAYLASPIDLVPDFIPVAGQLDDAIVVAIVLRILLRSGGEELLDEHWPGPDESREIVRQLAFGHRRSIPHGHAPVTSAGHREQ